MEIWQLGTHVESEKSTEFHFGQTAINHYEVMIQKLYVKTTNSAEITEVGYTNFIEIRKN